MKSQYINPTFGKIGDRLKKIRKDYGWTLQEVCNKVIDLSKQISSENQEFRIVKLNPSHLSKIEKNEVDTSDYYIALLCEVYEITISEVYSENTEDKQVNSNTLLHLPPHLKDFVSNEDNYYLLNMAYNLSKLNQKEESVNAVRDFLRIINV